MEIWFGSGHNRQIRKLRKLRKLGELRAVPARLVDSSGGFAADRGAMVSAGPALPPPREPPASGPPRGGKGGGASKHRPRLFPAQAARGPNPAAALPPPSRETSLPLD